MSWFLFGRIFSLWSGEMSKKTMLSYSMTNMMWWQFLSLVLFFWTLNLCFVLVYKNKCLSYAFLFDLICLLECLTCWCFFFFVISFYLLFFFFCYLGWNSLRVRWNRSIECLSKILSFFFIFLLCFLLSVRVTLQSVSCSLVCWIKNWTRPMFANCSRNMARLKNARSYVIKMHKAKDVHSLRSRRSKQLLARLR